jgi:uncharacterized protein YbaP (TraB family)
MKKRSFLLAFLLNLFIGLCAQSDGILWKISGKGLSRPSYLFGTIHYHCHPEMINRPAVQNAIRATSKVALEMNISDMDVLMAMYTRSLKPFGTSLVSLMDSKDYGIVDSACRYYLEDSLANFDTKSPMDLMTSMYLSEKFMSCKGLPIDFVIVEMAKKSGKKITGLESFEFQDSLMRSIPVEMQLKWLLEFCTDAKKAKREFVALTKAYNDQNSKELYTIALETSPESAYLKDALLVKRNISWVKFLESNMSLMPYFMAVGAGHLGGEEGLVSLLKKAGYTLTPVKI